MNSARNQPLNVTIAGGDRMQRFYILQNRSGPYYLLIKSDLEANVIYSKEITLDNKLVDVCGSKQSEDFYTLTATNDFRYAATVAAEAYTYTGGVLDSLCNGEELSFNYNYTPDFQEHVPLPTTNSSELKKFNKNGELVWSQTLDGNFFRENALETDPQGNIYVLTAIKSPKRSKLISKLSGSISYYSLIMNEHRISLYKFSSNGQLLFKKHVSNLLESQPGEFEPCLSLSNNAIFVSNLNNLMVFDLTGNLISNQKPLSDGCHNFISSVISSPYVPNAIIVGVIVRGTTSQKYCAEQNGASSVPSPFSATIPFSLLAVDRLKNVYAGNLAKYTGSGQEIFNKALRIGSYYVDIDQHNIALDANNNFYCFFPESQRLWVYKLNNDGDYQ